ncbi:unnamed protein product [Zymoseptoria tritici ST99CH_3D7]|uniref:Uncharacterized protein n=1 Tax=Zymoseptoria tritici (strain ST99CH_3D7) TaxID=1276538 RepID=A0A1X7RUU1_ZYMT9|nr:unnamed protein product [Zymoseptoria tritici ST99CH_3D7]
MLTQHLHKSLLPARHHSLSSTAAMRTRLSTNTISTRAHSPSTHSTRSLWSWGRSFDYSSRLDPAFHRCVRHRTLKTRAKLLDKVRRRSSWEGGAARHRIISPKQLRLFTHVGQFFKNQSEFASRGRFELSKHEQEWDQRMEAMKKLAATPYGNLFGKGLEPFWPWSRDNTDSHTTSQTPPVPANTARHATRRQSKDATEDADAQNGQQTNYGYSTYDPITNRMVPSDSQRDASRKAIHVPTASTTDTKKTAVYFPSLLNTSFQRNVKTSTLTKATPRSENDLDKLTAEDVRANMGRRVQDRALFSTKSSSSAPPSNEPLSSAPPASAPPSSSPPSGKPPMWFFPSKPQPQKNKQALQPAVQRMPTKERRSIPFDPDDSAAHESTGDGVEPSRVPPNWHQQQDILQQQRLARTRGTPPKPEETIVSKAEYEKLLKENQALKEELASDSKNIKYVQKIKDMKKVVDEAYKQSSVNAGMHVDYINELRLELDNAQKKNSSKVRDLKDELNQAYKQSSVHADMHLERIRDLEHELAEAKSALADKTQPAEFTQAEGDFDAANVGKYAKDSRWYKRPSSGPAVTTKDVGLDKYLKEHEKKVGDKWQFKAEDTDKLLAEQAARDKEIKDWEAGKRLSDEDLARLAEHEKKVGNKWKFTPKDTESLLQDMKRQDRMVAVGEAQRKAKKLRGERAMREVAEDEKCWKEYDLAHPGQHKFDKSKTETLLQDIKRQNEMVAAGEIQRKSEQFRQEQATREVAEDEKCWNEFDLAHPDQHKFDKSKTESLLQDMKRQDQIVARSEAQKKAEKLRAEQAVREVAEDAKCWEEYDQAHPDKYKFDKSQTDSLVKEIKQQDKLANEHQMKTNAQKMREQAAIAEVEQTKKYLAEYDQAHPNKYKFDKSQTEELIKEIKQQDKMIAANEARIKAEKLADERAAAARAVTELKLKEYDDAHPNQHVFDKAETDALVKEIKESDKIIAANEARIANMQAAADKDAAEIAMTEKALQEYDDAHPSKPFDPAETDKLLDEIKNQDRIAAKNVANLPDSSPAKDNSSQWEQPPVYKILAYDSGNDLFSTATTSSNVTGHESAISIPDALAQLYQPARFVPHFAELQQSGYQVIYGSKDLLVFKKLKETPDVGGEATLGHADTQAEPVTNLVEPMNHTVNPETKNRDSIYYDNANDIEIKHYPRVRREERVFSGRKKARRDSVNEDNLRRKYGWGSRIRWALAVGLGGSAVAYGVGAAVERKELREKERWEQIMKANQRRW